MDMEKQEEAGKNKDHNGTGQDNSTGHKAIVLKRSSERSEYTS